MSPPQLSDFGSTIPRGVTAAIGFANNVACHVTDYAGQQCIDPLYIVLTVVQGYLVVQRCIYPQYIACRHVFRMIQTTEKYRQFLKH